MGGDVGIDEGWIEVPKVHARAFRPPPAGGEPRVVLDNARQWRALRLWEPHYLKAAAGATEVSVRETAGPPRNVYQNLADGGRVTFAQYLDWVVETAGGNNRRELVLKRDSALAIVRALIDSGLERSYYLDAKLITLSKELLQDIQTPAWYSTDPVDVVFWCGVLGTSSGLHFDLTPNCNVQVFGHKHFILCPPSQSRRLYRIPGGAHCRFDPSVPDFDQFPLARQVQFWHCTLQAGESLYIPCGWFHQVTVTSAWAINVNFFWPRPFLQVLLVPAMWEIIVRRRWLKFRDRLRRA